MSLPYRLAVLCYLYDDQGRVLLIHRSGEPNRGLLSPVGGKLHVDAGESPTACARREIAEETGVSVDLDRLHLTGIVSEAGYEGQAHWLMFLYEVLGPVEVAPAQTREGRLDWFTDDSLEVGLLPRTDRHVIWPLVRRFRGRFFTAHIDCTGPALRWRLEQPSADAGGWTSVED